MQRLDGVDVAERRVVGRQRARDLDAETLGQHGRQRQHLHVAEARKYLDELLPIVKKMRVKVYDAAVDCMTGRVYTRENDLKHAEVAFESARALYMQMNDKFHLARVHYYQGEMYRNMHKSKKAKQCLVKAEEIFNELKNSDWLARHM